MPSSSNPWESLQPGEQWRGRMDTGIEGLPPAPVLAARGKVDGPRVTVFGAVHGDEYEGTAAIHALLGSLKPNELDELPGLVVGVPVANGAAWTARTRTTPQDGLDLNRCFPGDPSAHAPVTHRLAHVLFQNFVAPTDLLIDLHSGGVRLVHLPMIGWGTDSDGRAEALARIFGFDFYPWQVGTTPGVLTHEATRAGKIALGAEWGGGGSLDPAGIGAYADGVGRVLGALRPAAPWAYETDTRPPLVGGYLTAPISGIFHPRAELAEHVEAGATLGVVVDDLGEKQDVLACDHEGIVAGLAHLGRIEADEPYAYVGAQG